MRWGNTFKELGVDLVEALWNGLCDLANSRNPVVAAMFCLYIAVGFGCGLYQLFQLVAVQKVRFTTQASIEGALLTAFFSGVFWPLWMFLTMIIRSELSNRRAQTPEERSLIELQQPGEPDFSKCSECCRKLEPGSRFVWRRKPVCRACREALSMLDA